MLIKPAGCHGVCNFSIFRESAKTTHARTFVILREEKYQFEKSLIFSHRPQPMIEAEMHKHTNERLNEWKEPNQRRESRRAIASITQLQRINKH